MSKNCLLNQVLKVKKNIVNMRDHDEDYDDFVYKFKHILDEQDFFVKAREAWDYKEPLFNGLDSFDDACDGSCGGFPPFRIILQNYNLFAVRKFSTDILESLLKTRNYVIAFDNGNKIVLEWYND